MNKKPYHILIVDDTVTNLSYAEEVLKGQYKLAMAKSGMIALKFLEKNKPDLILLDINMPDMSGYDVFEALRDNPNTADIPVIFLTAVTDADNEAKGFELGAADYIKKPFDANVMLKRIKNVLEREYLRRKLQSEVQDKTMEIETIVRESFVSIADIIDAKGYYAHGHSRRVAKYATAIARKIGWSEQEIFDLHYMALLHDIGKIGVSDTIMNKIGALSVEEYSLVQRHAEIGADLLRESNLILGAAEVVESHHEWYDGTGYPKGLSGKDIPEQARIIAIADAYDAMLVPKFYHKEMTPEEIREEIVLCTGTQFDPIYANALLELIDEGVIGQDSLETEAGGEYHLATESNRLLQKIVMNYTEEMKDVSVKDPLTQTWTRSYMENQVNLFLHLQKQPGAFFMIDIDNFKSINDLYGHQKGDKLLQVFSNLLHEVVRKDDLICRLGGDEFVLFLKNMCERQKISDKAELLLRRFQEEMAGPERFGMVSLSVGIAVAPFDGEDFTTLYNNADKALYYVKQNGKSDYHYYTEQQTYSVDAMNYTINSQIRLEHLMDVFGEKRAALGAYRVGYEGFQKIYQFIQRSLIRTEKNIQVILFSLQREMQSESDWTDIMEQFGEAITVSLRSGDVATVYGTSQYVVLLMDADETNGRMVAERIQAAYRNKAGENSVESRIEIGAIEKKE